ncbi:hypothetical protein NEF87_001223 [Candidatus Lokiarchaeum ossiferum]|uniref:Uncharacterized protein n=1 Tax=Candidatus Lokiarchaeum ossiferum TaxID=2951803 RepID=A0ABY6HN49_9ARCH|nr:hypothetical protein NEF87_001223 [Candidatus Lokiarchaeum sp. B-35]
MSKKNYPLSNQLIEGFLYKFLTDWKNTDEIFSAILDNFGSEMCVPSELSKNGEIKYIHKTKSLLLRGCKNGIYSCDKNQTKFKKNE